ncbi:uncharacterized protein PHALS_00420 [Plasmopara halstedii]|uniref:Uncharacterized protein n=1 Tax=Plasmopara halstedii TaxID=4781 RepID=A0A0P1A680_PLAHL|nr:uncharacterized protein PHALS_00420 [Plasmopara halstedii]CEG36101.1 hypothetical protein PHALS_00420 [Plasmopara halstedii]|eukprot:XP_024572470.1 hypothetical protein PHALS_00420 [Plasmopara halstedii]
MCAPRDEFISESSDESAEALMKIVAEEAITCLEHQVPGRSLYCPKVALTKMPYFRNPDSEFEISGALLDPIPKPVFVSLTM